MGLYDQLDKDCVYGTAVLTEFSDLEPVKSYFAPSLKEGEVLTDLEPANACVRLIMRTNDGYFIDHLHVNVDINDFWVQVNEGRDLSGARIVVSGGNDYSEASRYLVSNVCDALTRNSDVHIVGYDLLGDLNRQVYVYKDAVIVTRQDFTSGQYYDPINFKF
jgi:hypothetical protein